jgi:hypothetical protein
MLPEEQTEISRHFYDLASARSGFGWENWVWCRRSISRVCKGPKLAQAAPCLATKCRAKLHRCAACNRGHQQSLCHGILTGPTLARSRNLLTKCALLRAESLSATNSWRSIFKKTWCRFGCGRGNVSFAGRNFIAPLINMRFNRLTVRPLVQKKQFLYNDLMPFHAGLTPAVCRPVSCQNAAAHLDEVEQENDK